MKTFLTVAGLDPCGGAGIVADIKTAKSIGFFPFCVVTTLTVQNTTGVYGVYPVDSDIIEEQMRKIAEDLEIDAIKVGLLPNLKVAEVLAKFLKDLDAVKVLDPVIYSGTGTKMGSEDAYRMLMKYVDVITPNFTEAKILSSKNSVFEAGEELKKYVKAVVITGGELGGKDHVFESNFYTVEAEFSNITIHGTGCVYSSALACYLAEKGNLEDAVRLARLFVLESVKKSLVLGKGHPCVNP